MAQKSGETAMNVQAIAALSNAEHNEQQKLARETYQSVEEKQKQDTARDRLAQIVNMLPKQDRETAGTELEMERLVDEGLLARLCPDCGGDREQGVEGLEMVRGEGDIGEGGVGEGGIEEEDIEEGGIEEGGIEEGHVEEGDVEEEDIEEGDVWEADIGERDVEEWGIDLLTYLQQKEQRTKPSRIVRWKEDIGEWDVDEEDIGKWDVDEKDVDEKDVDEKDVDEGLLARLRPFHTRDRERYVRSLEMGRGERDVGEGGFAVAREGGAGGRSRREE
ncbi:uncharacterized protein EAE98_005194 [Botrytis deweyae]|uniref:Uncharacterized protein n=1 Tax=Botrytis deweyae TaxID=2478750 RepID=A0ABQ7IN66_9HELO|nr:uncharacterized protein EAE98_005194 [Botrytis deweyae]KAF7929275.1 hypothetical protein EAE98_005194 [Botrytis deweyae]